MSQYIRSSEQFPDSLKFVTFFLALTLATWSVRDLANKASISASATKKIVNALFNNCGMSALSITMLLNELLTMGFDIPKFLVEEKLLVPVLNYFVHSAHDFVTAAGCNFLREMFSMNDSFSFGPVDEIFAFALSVVASPNVCLLYTSDAADDVIDV